MATIDPYMLWYVQLFYLFTNLYN